MRHLLITLGTALAVVAVFLLARSTMRGKPADAEALRPPPLKQESPAEPLRASPPGPVTITGLSELDALHQKHGKVGEAMRNFLAYTRGLAWNNVERSKMQEVLHAVKNNVTEDDIPYLVDLFNKTPDPSFRWWFSWLVQQVPDGRFVDAMTEVWRLDPHRGIDALASINTAFALDRYLKLMDTESDAAIRQHAVVSLAHSDWDKREGLVSEIARDQARGDGERLEALTALGRTGQSADSMALLMEVALGPPKPVSGLTGSLAVSHPVPDLRSGAVLAVMQRGDQESARRLIEAADAPGADPNFTKIVDAHIASFTGPDLSELIYDRAARRGFVTPGEVHHLIRDPERMDKARLRDLLPLIKDADAKTLAQRMLGQ